MKKMSKEAQLQANGGKVYHEAYCVSCYARFVATKWWQGEKYVINLAVEHCYDKGGPSSGHRYVLLY